VAVVKAFSLCGHSDISSRTARNVDEEVESDTMSHFVEIIENQRWYPILVRGFLA
jgi:hypothetical protein